MAQVVPPPVIQNFSMQGNNAVISFSTVQDAVYLVGCTSDIRAGSWSLLGTVIGNGSVVTFTDTSTTASSRYYGLTVGMVNSVNAVGYVRRLIRTGTNLVSNPFSTASNTLDALLPNCPDGTQLYKNASISSEYFSGAWEPANLSLSPGEGAILFNPSSSFEVVFAGEVPQGTLYNAIPAGWWLLSSKAPTSASLDFPAEDGTLIRTWNATNQTYTWHEFLDGLGWDTPPVVQSGEAFWAMRPTPANWVQSFTVNGPSVGSPYPIIFRQPASCTNAPGTTATLTVGAVGSEPLSYRWRFNDIPLSDGGNVTGTTATNLTITSLDFTNAGSYSVVVSNPFGSVTSSVAMLTVLLANSDRDGDGLPNDWELANGLDPDNPADAQSDTDGDGMSSLEEYVAGTDPLSALSCMRLAITRSAGSIVLTWPTATRPWVLQSTASLAPGTWQDIVGSPTSPLTMSVGGPQRFFRLACSGTNLTVYSLNIVGYINQSISPGGSVISNPLNCGDNSIARVIPDPADETVVIMGAVENWYILGWGGWDNPGMLLAPGAAFEIWNPSTTSFVNTFVGELTSSPVIAVHPGSFIGSPGTQVTLLAAAYGAPPLAYQWRFDGEDLPGANASTLTLANLQLFDSGNYDVVVSNFFGSVTSRVATVTVSTPPVITTHPRSQAWPLGYPVSFVVAAQSPVPLAYQWFRNGISLPGATSATYTIASLQLTDVGTYTCQVSNLAGTVISAGAQLTILTENNCRPYPAGLIAWWPGDGSANDIMGANHGSLIAGAGFAPGLVGQAFVFTETNDCVAVPHATALNGDGSFTVEAWINPRILVSQQPQWPRVAAKQDWSYAGAAPGWSLSGSGTASGWPGYLGIGIQDASGNARYANASLPDLAPANQWTHVAGVYHKTAGLLQFYLNGVLQQQTDTIGLGSITNAAPLYLGASSPGWDHFDGAIDEVSLYDRALTTNEIAAIYLAGAFGKCRAPGYFLGFDLAASAASWIGWWGPPTPLVAWDPAVDADNDPASGSLKVVENFSGTGSEQLMMFGTFGNHYAWDNTVVLDARQFDSVAFDLKVADGSAPNIDGTYGVLEVGLVAEDWSWSRASTITLPLTNDWIHLSVPLDPTWTKLSSAVGVYLKMWSDGVFATPLVFWVDNLQLLGDGIVGAGTPVTFRVDLADDIASGVFKPATGAVTVRGSFNDWQSWFVLTNSAPGSTIYSRTLPILGQPGTLAEYKFVINNNDGTGEHWELGTNRVFALPDSPLTLPLSRFNNGLSVPLKASIQFQVEMNAQIGSGLFNALSDQVWVRGFGMGWGVPPNGLLLVEDAARPGLFTNVFTMTNLLAGEPFYFKPVIWRPANSNVVWESVPARVLVFSGNEPTDAAGYHVQNVGPFCFNDDCRPPLILAPPTNQVVNFGANATFTVHAAGASPLAYQWYYYGRAIPGATDATYTILNAGETDNGRYTVVVTNAYGAASAMSLLTLSQYPSATAGLVAYYPLDGTAADISGNGNDGSTNGVVPETDRFGMAAACFRFDGSGQYITAPATRLPSGPRTISLWFKLDTVDTRPGLLGYGGSGGDSFFAGLNHWGNESFTVSTHYDSYTHSVPYGNPPTNQWFHWVIVQDDEGMRFYVDGVMIGARSGTTQTYVAGTQLGLGTISGPFGGVPYVDANVGYLDGCLDDVRIYDRPLSASEVAFLFALEKAAPVIVAQPQSRTNLAGTAASFFVSCFGANPLSYQWTRNGTNLLDGPRVTGAASASLTISNVQPQDAGDYTVVIANPYGSTTSAVAVLTLTAPCVTVSAANPFYPMGTPVPLHVLSFDCVTSNALPNVSAFIYITTAGTTRSITATTGANGEATVQFHPLSGEAGRYGISAGLPDQPQPPAQSQFALVGFEFSTNQLTHRLIVGIPVTNHVEIRNLTDVPLSDVTVSLLDSTPGVLFQAYLPDATLGAYQSSTLAYVLTATAAGPDVLGRVRVTSAEGALNDLPMSVQVVPPFPQLVATPASLGASMLRGEQTLVQLRLSNTGGAPANDIRVMLPEQTPWLSVVSSSRIASLGVGESTTVILALTPAPDLPLGPYRSHILLHSVEVDLAVPYEFTCASALAGDLRVEVVDEFTYFSEGAPRLTNATVTVKDYWSGTNVATGVTDPSGSVLFTNLIEGYYDIDVRADKHGGFGTTFLVVSGQTNELVAFLSRETVSYKWVVIPTEDPDHYDIQLETVFEVAVPWPTVTIDPPDLNLCNFADGIHDVNLTVTNHGLITAAGLQLTFPSHPAWEITLLTGNLGDLAARSSKVVPVRIRRTAPHGNVPSRMDGRLDYSFTGDNLVFPRSLSLPVWNANAWDCVAPPWISIEPATLDMCSFADSQSVDFTIRNHGTMDVAATVFEFDSHVHWQIQPAVANLGTLPAQSTRVVSVLFTKVPSLTSGPSTIQGRVSYQATLQGGTRHFLRTSKLHNPNPWDCVPQPLLTIQPAWLDMCGLAPETSVNFTIHNQGPVRTEAMSLSFPAHPHWQIEPLVSNLAPLDPQTTRVVTVLFRKISSPVDGPSTIPGQLNYQATVDGETRSFAPEVPLYRANAWDCVPQPPVLIEPSFINLCHLRAVTNPITFTIHNRSSVSAEAAKLVFDNTHPHWQFQPALTNLGILNPYSTTQVVVEIIQTPTTTNGSRNISAHLDYRATVEVQPRNFSVPVYIVNANDTDCVAPPGGGDGGGGGWPQEYRYVHVRGKLLFQQVVTVSRNTFTASLELINNSSTSPLSLVSVNLQLLDALSAPAADRFGVSLHQLTGLTAIDGTGLLDTNSSGTVVWKIIPATNAAPSGPTIYTVGGEISFMQDGEPLKIPLYPVTITVLPDPRLCLDYFWEKTAYSDDALTPPVEPAIPFAVGLLLRNEGQGTARSVQVETMQPRIVENKSGLLISFNLLSAQLGGQSVPPNIQLNLGDLPPSSTTEAIWWMTSSLLADFIEYKATFSHLDDLGQRNLSLIDRVRLHPTLHVVRADVPSDDLLPDFLAMDAFPTNPLPDTLYLSDGSVLPVTALTNGDIDGPPTLLHTNVLLTIPAPLPSGWVYLRIPDPAPGVSPAFVKRSDGRQLLLDWNVWTTWRIVYPTNSNPYVESFLHILDKDTTGSYTLGYNLALYFVNQPQDSTNVLGTAATFEVQMGGASPFAYQWQKNGANLSGATNATLSLSNVQVSDEGWYSVIVTNRAGEVRSRDAWLKVLVPPVITLQPLNTTNLVGTPAVFSVAATSETPCSYQWFQNGIARPGETNTILSISARQLADEGLYHVEVRNQAGTSTSMNAFLKVLVPPVICPVPDQVVTVGRQLSITNCASDPHAPVSFSLGFGPPGASVSSNGVFHWTPDCAVGNSTNLVQICATDSDTAPSTSCITFRVAVLECIEAALGKSVVLAGHTGSVSIQLISTTILTNMAFTVIYPVERFTTNFTLAINSPDILTQHCEVVTPGQLLVRFALPSNRPLYGPTKIGELGFATLPDQPSAFVYLPIVDVAGLKPDGSTAANAFGFPGRVVMLGEAPLLECLLVNGSPLLVLYGKPASGYGIDTRTDLILGGWQSALGNLTIGTSLYLELVPPPSSYPANFYRAFRAPQP